jgi:pyrroline-5-carboxylate reductase
MKTIGFIGGGRITRILLQGFKNANVSFGKIFVYETDESVLNELKSGFPQIEATNTDPGNTASADLVFLALHPPVLKEFLMTFKNLVKHNAMVVSLAPKITIDILQTAMPQTHNIARMNPNAATFVNMGFNPVCFANEADKNVVKEFIQLFEKLGRIPVVPEVHMEAYAVISAMGHTYFWFQLEQLKELAMSFGLSEPEAKKTISVMLQGTAETLFNSGLPFQEVADLVPVKPMAEYENNIKESYKNALNGIYQKIKP